MRTNPAYARIIREATVVQVIDGRRWILAIGGVEYVVAVRSSRRRVPH
jgi:hypothetical protein